MIKWFDSRAMDSIPVINNTQGELVAMLSGLLVNGVNIKPVTSVSYANGLCTLTVGAAHGFVRHAVIKITETTQPVLIDNEFKVELITPTTISFKSAAVIAEVGLSVRYAPLGYTSHFQSEGRACYRSKNPLHTEYLRVDDTKLAGTNAVSAKFATVEICEDMTDFNTVIGSQAPHTAEYPLQNRQTIAGRSNGWFKWYYAAAYGTGFLETGTLASEKPTAVKKDYMLIGDDRGFYFVMYPDTRGAVLYGFFSTSENVHLLANNGFDATRYDTKNILGGYNYSLCSLYGFQGATSDGTNYITPTSSLTSPVLNTNYGQVFFRSIVAKIMKNNVIYDVLPRVYASETSAIESSVVYSGASKRFLSFKQDTTALLFEVT